MMKKYVYLLFLMIAVLTTHLIAQPSLDILITDPNPEVIYVADLDIMQLASANEFFEIAISNFEAQSYNCTLTLSFYKDQRLLAKIESTPFTIPAQMGRRSANNVELMRDDFYLTDDHNIENQIDVHESEIFTDEVDNLEEDILSSGKLPIGHYELVGVLTGSQFGTEETSDFFDITNPSFVELITPGAEAGSGFKEEVYTEFPVFQWNGNGSQYQVVVFEKKFALQSLDNVLNMTPNWESEKMDNYNVQYPQAGEGGNMVIPLEFGKTYYWMIRMFVQTSAGEEVINSEIWEFQLVDPITLGDEQNAIARNMLIEFLRDLIGDKADELAKQLGDYNVKTINVNGQDMSVEDLYLLINEYRLKDVEVVDLILPTGSY
ncbi:MAG: hypothetical protein P8Y99_00215 [Calditrichaceae bacterium]|jgi:hypothetical protein